MSERDRYGDNLRDVKRAREDQWAAERDRELLVELRQQADERETAGPVDKYTAKAFRRILCPTDFEACSLNALDLAGWLAAQNDADLYLLNVCQTVTIPLRSRD